MTTKKRKSTKPRTKLPPTGLHPAQADNGCSTQAPPAASQRAKGLAEMVMRLATQKPGRNMTIAPPLDSIASAIDSTLRFDTAMAETNGIDKGRQEVRAEVERGTLTGIVARVQYQMENMKIGAETITISAAEAIVLAHYLERQGFTGYKRRAKNADTELRWDVRYAPDGSMLASRERA